MYVRSRSARRLRAKRCHRELPGRCELRSALLRSASCARSGHLWVALRR